MTKKSTQPNLRRLRNEMTKEKYSHIWGVNLEENERHVVDGMCAGSVPALNKLVHEVAEQSTKMTGALTMPGFPVLAGSSQCAIIASGTGFDKEQRELFKKHQGQFFTIVTDSAYLPCIRDGIKVGVVVSVDPQGETGDNPGIMKFFHKKPASPATSLVASMFSPPSIRYCFAPGRTFYFAEAVTQDEATKAGIPHWDVMQRYGRLLGSAAVTGSIMTVAMQIAYKLGFRDILTFGTSYSLKKGQYYWHDDDGSEYKTALKANGGDFIGYGDLLSSEMLMVGNDNDRKMVYILGDLARRSFQLLKIGDTDKQRHNIYRNDYSHVSLEEVIRMKGWKEESKKKEIVKLEPKKRGKKWKK